MIYVHHVPRVDAADKLSRLVASAESVPRLRQVSGHARDTIADSEKAPEAESGSGAAVFEWARQDSNLGPTDYESERRDYRSLPVTTGRQKSRAIAASK